MGLTKPRAGQINFDATNITDPLIRINSGQSGANDKDAGWVVERGSDANVALIWDESADEFVLVNTTEDGTTSGNVTISSYADIQVGTINVSTLEIGGTAVTSTATELNYTDGVTSNIQTQLDAKGTGTVSSLSDLSITATATELNYTSGVTSAIQTQLDGKASTSHNHTLDGLSNVTITTNSSGEVLVWNGSAWVNNTLAEAGIQPSGSYLTGNETITLSGDVSGSGTTSIAVTIADDSHNHIIGNVDGLQTALDAKAPTASPTFTGTLTYATLNDGTTALTSTVAELNYVDGVTSNVQTQLDAKAPTSGPTFTGTDGIVIPSGTTEQRPVSPATGTIRFNTTDSRFEGYNGTAWVPIDTLYS